MNALVLVALLVAIPVILFPVAFIWYLNISGAYHAIQEARQKRKAGQRQLAAEKEFVETTCSS